MHLLLFILFGVVAGCSGHHLDSYDVSLSTGETTYRDYEATKTTTVGGKIDFHFKVKR